VCVCVEGGGGSARSKWVRAGFEKYAYGVRAGGSGHCFCTLLLVLNYAQMCSFECFTNTTPIFIFGIKCHT
jgi:hypothetical protein